MHCRFCQPWQYLTGCRCCVIPGPLEHEAEVDPQVLIVLLLLSDGEDRFPATGPWRSTAVPRKQECSIKPVVVLGISTLESSRDFAT